MNASLQRLGYCLCLALLLLLLAVPLLWIPLSLHLPLARDQGIFAWAGQVVLGGGIPYIDLWEVKGPMVHLLYAAALFLFGETEMAVRLFDALMMLFLLLGFLRLGKLWEAPLAGWFSFAIAFSLLGTGYWNRAQPDGWAAVTLLWVAVLVLPPRVKMLSLLGGGILLGLAALMKPVYILFGALILVREAVSREPGGFRRIFLFSAATVLPLLAAVGIYASLGHLHTFLDVYLLHNLQCHLMAQRNFSLSAAMVNLLQLVVSWQSIVATVFAVTAIFLLWERRRMFALVMLCGIAAGYLCVFIQHKWYGYHLMPYLIFLAGLAGYTLAYFHKVFSGRDEAPSGVCTCIAILLLLLYIWGVTLHTLKDTAMLWNRYLRSSESEWFAYFMQPDFNYRDTHEAAQYVATHSASGDSLYLWGFDSLLNFLAGRPSPTRLGFNYSMVVGCPDYIAARRAELMESLRAHPPEFIAVQKHDSNNLMPHSSEEYLLEFDILTDFMNDRYQPVFENGTYRLYRKSWP